jgi:hypothetical protein
MPLVVDVIYQVLLVADLEIDSFTIAGQVEYILVLGLGILEMSGFLLANHKMHSKGIPINSALRRD